MNKEIERKFLVEDKNADSWRNAIYSEIRQGYLSVDKQRTVRVRIAGDSAYLTIKGITAGATRAEYEYPIPVAHAREMLDDLCLRPLIEKRRYRVGYGGLVWEVDEFYGDNAGLIVAEVELKSAQQVFDRPPWAGEEVTDDPRYYNANLVNHPYTKWKSR
ncbi:CYTH domain-containing protein [Nitrosospira lacus]|uniref:CYTH domain-containing protein n=1 Tax=Nitrosospira lacus TaxID=1288494 RepID=A0A1W6SPL7_9PROT|nr:CYTH domain-containing protein [Nitrosospira lacus]ARO87737.1 CYTH domain-containing protein [Nitrosospira lacus]